MSPIQLGPYRVERTLGRGGMGKVYAAVDDNTGAAAAVKVLTATLADDPHFRRRFEGEIEALKMLGHRHIVRLLGYGEEKGELFYAMELVQGCSLQDALKERKRFSWRDTVRMGIEICSALRHAHDRGVVHRDLKPANLLIDDEGHVKLTDFGIAKLFGASKLTADGGVIGSADYMSPEQAIGEPATVRSDLYSLGSVLYALLSGVPPFAEKTLPEVLQALRFKKHTAISRLAEIPPELEAVIDRLLQKDPQKRIATAQAVANRLLEIEHLYPEDEQPSSDIEEPETGVDDSSEPALLEPATTDEMRASEIDPDEEGSIALVTTKEVAENEDAASLAASGELELDSSVSEVSPAQTRFTTVAESARLRRMHEENAAEPPHRRWLVVVVLLGGLALLTTLGFYALRPPSADDLYRRIAEAAGSGEIRQLARRENDVRRFLKRFPDDARHETVAAHLEEIELFRVQERFEMRLQTRSGGDSLSAAESAYLDAYQHIQRDPNTAASRLQAVIDLYGGDEDAATRRCVELARKQLARLKLQSERDAKRLAVDLAERLRRAKTLRTSDPDRAAALCRAAITLYADRPWAQPFIQQARDLLDELADSSQNKSNN